MACLSSGYWSVLTLSSVLSLAETARLRAGTRGVRSVREEAVTRERYIVVYSLSIAWLRLECSLYRVCVRV